MHKLQNIHRLSTCDVVGYQKILSIPAIRMDNNRKEWAKLDSW